MCRTFLVSWTDIDGEPMDDADLPAGFDFPHDAEDEDITCTCWIGDGTPTGDALYERFSQKLKPLIAYGGICGRIVIEVL